MFHGAPWMPLEGRVYPDFAEWERFGSCTEEIILLGHTHYPMVKEWRGKVIINPGSVGQPRSRSGAAEYAVLDVAKRSVVFERAPYDVSRVIQDARRHDPQMSYLVEVLSR
jgi:diadenosine tetraphosphatase ApaH/serine/threonine PP2A family protein phosphatase